MVGPWAMIFGCAKSSDLLRWESTIVGAEKIGIDWWPNCSFMRWAHQRELKKSILPLWWKLKKPFHLCFMFHKFHVCFSLYVEPAPKNKKPELLRGFAQLASNTWNFFPHDLCVITNLTMNSYSFGCFVWSVTLKVPRIGSTLLFFQRKKSPNLFFVSQ